MNQTDGFQLYKCQINAYINDACMYVCVNLFKLVNVH